MKRIFLVYFLVQVTQLSHGQSTPPSKILSNYTQPAPNAASLGKYVDYPIGYYTGTPEINIPLYELNDGAAKLPVTLSYHASGIRVSEMASWVGLGWALNAGGMIIRSVRGGPDEGVGNPQATPHGYYIDSGLRKMPNVLPAPIGSIIPAGDISNEYSFLFSLSGGGADCEPDLYTFNFNGYSGKFVFDENKTPQLLSQQDLKISVDMGSSDFQSWSIVTPEGVRYYFGENGMHEVNEVYSGALDANTLRPSSWYLTKIIYPNTKDTVLFTYSPETYSYCDLGPETALYDQTGNGPNIPQNACAESISPPMNSLKTIVEGLRLTSIKSKNSLISFVAKTQRQDLDLNPFRLDSVKIFNNENQCIKQYLFSYTYFTSTSATGASAGAMGVTNGSGADMLRLKLLSVKEFSGDGLISKPPYIFTYQETKQLPRRMSFDQDHWGFSNNSAGSVRDRFTPTVSHSICFRSPYFPQSRDAKWPDMQAFSIKSIADPLGVVTSFEFEPHTSSLMLSGELVGGLRIHKILTLDGVTGDSTVRLYDYGTGGVLYNKPKYLIEPHNEFYYPIDQFFASYSGYITQEFQTLRSLLKQSQSIVPLQDFQGNHIGYPNVKEIFGPHGEGGYKVHSFMADQVMTTSRLSLDNYTQVAYVNSALGYDGSSTVQPGIYGNGHFNDISPASLVYCSPYMAMNYYPFAPEQVDFRRGRQLSEDTYDSSGNMLHSEYNEYKEYYDETKWIRGFKLFRSFRSSLSIEHLGTFYQYNDAFTYYKLHTGITHLIKRTVKDYKDGKTFTTTTTYGYESAFHTQQTSDTTVNSTGDTLITKTYYTFDYANTATTDNVFAKLKARNMLLPVSTRVWKNNKLISGSITQFKDFAATTSDTLISPQKIFSLEVSSPLSTSQAGENIRLTGLLPTLVPNTYFIEKANFNYDGSTGKILEQKLLNNKNQSLIWDDQLSLPLAVVDNANPADVAYNSFETTETGNWSYTAAYAVADASAPTGSRVYTLNASDPLKKTGLTTGKQYILSYWVKSSGSVTVSGGTRSNIVTGNTINTSWTYKQMVITSTAATLSLTGSGFIDEVRLYPVNAQMTSYTYDSFMRLTDQCGANSLITQYEYDSFNRLTDIKDQYRNVIKAFDYNYGGLSR